MTSNESKGRPARREATGAQGARRRKGSAMAAGRRRGSEGRWARMLTPWVEGLEDRRLLATITWSTTAAPTGNEWNNGANWVGGKVPGPGDTAVITGLKSPGIVTLTGAADSVASATTDSSVNLEVISGSLSLGAGSSSTFGGPVTVETGTSLSIGTGSTLQLSVNETLTGNGTLTFASGDTVTMSAGGCCASSAAIAVGGTGTLTAAGTTFAGGGGPSISVAAGGHLTASNSTFGVGSLSLATGSVLNAGDLTGDAFNLPIYVPYVDVQYLGGNTSFQQIEINGGTIPSGTLALNAIGTNTSKLSYVFPGNFTIASGATVAVGPNVPVSFPVNETLTDNGTLSFAAGDTVTMSAGGCCASSAVIAVGGTGTLTVAGTTFAGGGGPSVSVAAGGHLMASNSTFGVGSLSLATGSVLNAGDLTGDAFNLPIYVPYVDMQYLGGNTSFQQIEINGGTIPSGTLALNAIGTNTTNLSYVFPGNFTIASGATVAVGPNVPVSFPVNETLTDDGTLSFASGDTVTMSAGGCCASSAAIAVGGTGTLTVAGTTFAGGGGPSISVAAGGHLTASNSTFGVGSLSLATGSVLNAGDLTGDTFNLPIYVPYVDVQYLGGNTSFQQIEINAGTIPSGTLALNAIGTNTTNLSYVFPGNFTIASGATVAVGPNVPVSFPVNETLTDNGTLSFASGDTVTMSAGGCCASSAAIAVGGTGTLTVAGTTFAGGGGPSISVAAGGHLMASNSTFGVGSLSLATGSVLNAGDLTGDTFSLPIYVPYVDVQYLGGNTSFQQIEINAGTIASGTLALNAIGSNTANLSYVFAGNFTIAPGAAVAVGPNVPVTFAVNETLTDNGTLTFASGDTVTMSAGGCCASSAAIAVAGTLTAAGMSFAGGGGPSVSVNSGGSFSLSNSTFNAGTLNLNAGSTDAMTGVVFTGVLNINSGAAVGSLASPTITGDNFSNLGNQQVVATGDPNASIPFSGNYWGTTVIAQITAKILDHSTNPTTRPTLSYQPFVSGASGTTASPAPATFSPTSQTINLSATVSTTAGVAINEGTETFTILSGTQVIGQTTAPANVSNGAVTATYTLPAGTAPGQYIIEASYSGSANYLPAADFGHLLTISPAATTTTTTNASATFNSASSQTINLSAQVSSGAGAVNEGIVTFTILSGGNPVGSPVIANVSGNAASATYTLLANTSGGSYTIQAVYTDPVDFKTSTGTNTLTVAAAATTITTSNLAAAYNASAGEGVALAANVSSTAGTINQGTATFTITDSSSKQVAQTVVSVANGLATKNYLLPAGTAPGTYNIQVVYNGTPSYAASLPATATLTIGAATTTTAATNATAAAGASPTLTATVTSPAGVVNTGSVLFTVLNGSTPIGTAQSANVTNGTASVSYPVPGNTLVGTYTIQAVYGATTDFVTSSDSTHSLVVTPPGAAKLFIQTEPAATANAGQPFATAGQPVVVYEEDANGNLETSDNSTVITASIGSGAGPLTGTTTVTVVGGVATFTNLGDNAAGTITLTFSSGNLASVTSSTIAIAAGAAAKLLVSQQPASTATAGQVFGTQPVVEVVDQYGNPVAGDSTDTVTAARGDQGTSTLLGNKLTVTLVNGVATFSGLSYNKAEAMDITFTSSASGLSPVTSNAVLVGATTPSQLVIQQEPSSTATAGQPFPTQPVVYEEDQFGNLETGDNTTPVTAVLTGGTGPLQGTTTVTLSGGAAHFSNLADNTAETIKLVFSGGGFTTPASNPIAVGAAAAAKLVIQTQPSSTATAGQPFAVQPVVYLEDANGNLETGDNTTQVTVSLASGSGTLQGTATVTVKGGIATFAGLFDTKAGAITLGFSASDGLTAGPSNTIVITPAAASQLVIGTQPSSTATAGQAFVTQPVVFEEDQYGNIETGDNSTVVTAALASGTGPLQGTMSATVQAGVATFAGLNDPKAETITLAFSAGTLVSQASNPVVIGPGAAVKLSIVIGPYATVVAGNPLTDPIVVDELDQYDNVVSTDNSTQVTASMATGSGTLYGTTTVTVQGGVASFPKLENDKAGPLSLQFTAGTLPPVVASPSVVTPAPATQLVVRRPPGGVISGSTFAVEVDALDPYGNVDTSFDAPVTVGLGSGSGGTLGGTLTQSAQAGVANFNDLVRTTSGNTALTASTTSSGVASGSSDSFTVSPAAPALLVIQVQPQQTATAGTPFVTPSQSVVVYEKDQYGNLEAGDSTTQVTVFLGSGAGPLQGTLTATLAGGIATFTNLADDIAGTITLQFAGAGINSSPSVPIVISPAAAAKLVISQPPSGSATAGVAVPTPPVVTEEDQYGNVVTTDNSTTITAALASGAGPLQGTTSIVLSGGVATFANLADDLAETITLAFSGGGLNAGPSSPIVVGPAAAAKLVIQQEPSQTETAGVPFTSTPIIVEEDQYNNVETGDNTATINAFLASGDGVLSGATAVAVKGGVASFTTLAEDRIGTYTLAFTGGGLTSPASIPFVVTMGAPSMLVVQTPPSSGSAAGQTFATQPVVYVVDAGGNLETGDNTTVVTASVVGGQITGTTAVTVSGGVATFSDLASQKAGPVSLAFSAAGLTSAPPTPISVNSGPATHWAIHAQPSSTATTGQAFAVQPIIYEEDQYGNLVTGDNSTVVTVSLASGSGPLQGTTSVTVSGGVATFTGLADGTAETISMKFAGGGLTTTTSDAVAIAPPPPTSPTTPTTTPTSTPGPTPTITGEQVLMSRKIKKGKPVGKAALTGFVLQYSEAMSPATAGSSANYVVGATTIKRIKKKKVTTLTPVGVSASYDAVKHTVTLTLSGKQTFAAGGQIRVIYSSPGGVSGEDGVALGPNDATFTIQPKATGIARG